MAETSDSERAAKKSAPVFPVRTNAMYRNSLFRIGGMRPEKVFLDGFTSCGLSFDIGRHIYNESPEVHPADGFVGMSTSFMGSLSLLLRRNLDQPFDQACTRIRKLYESLEAEVSAMTNVAAKSAGIDRSRLKNYVKEQLGTIKDIEDSYKDGWYTAHEYGIAGSKYMISCERQVNESSSRAEYVPAEARRRALIWSLWAAPERVPGSRVTGCMPVDFRYVADPKGGYRVQTRSTQELTVVKNDKFDPQAYNPFSDTGYRGLISYYASPVAGKSGPGMSGYTLPSGWKGETQLWSGSERLQPTYKEAIVGETEPTVKKYIHNVDASGALAPGSTLRSFKAEQVEIGQKINSGAYGTVYRGQVEGKTVAVKVFNKQNGPGGYEEERDAAIKIGKARGIVSAIGIIEEKGKDSKIVYELANSVNFLHGRAEIYKLPLATRAVMCLDLCSAMQSLHSRGIIHRDFAPRNLLVKMNGELALADFGLTEETQKETYRAYLGKADGRGPGFNDETSSLLFVISELLSKDEDTEYWDLKTSDIFNEVGASAYSAGVAEAFEKYNMSAKGRQLSYDESRKSDSFVLDNIITALKNVKT